MLRATIAMVEIGVGRGGAVQQARAYENELKSFIEDLKGESSK